MVAGESLVQRRQFAPEDRQRPAVGHDVMKAEGQDVFFRLYLEQRGAQQGTMCQVERLRRLGLQPPGDLGGAPGPRPRPHVHPCQDLRRNRADLLHGPPVLGRKGRAQRLMAL